jgi:hypothetical protein
MGPDRAAYPHRRNLSRRPVLGGDGCLGRGRLWPSLTAAGAFERVALAAQQRQPLGSRGSGNGIANERTTVCERPRLSQDVTAIRTRFIRAILRNGREPT